MSPAETRPQDTHTLRCESAISAFQARSLSEYGILLGGLCSQAFVQCDDGAGCDPDAFRNPCCVCPCAYAIAGSGVSELLDDRLENLKLELKASEKTCQALLPNVEAFTKGSREVQYSFDSPYG